MLKKLFVLSGLTALSIASLTSHAESSKLSSSSDPHFYIAMENQSDKDATVTFQPVVGNITLSPALADQTPLPAHQRIDKRGVIFSPLVKADQFNVTFTGKQDCTFNVAFFAPGDPKVTISGYGCAGGGYQVVDGGYTLLLFVSDINAAKK